MVGFISSLLILFFIPAPALLDKLSFSQAIYDEGNHLLRLTLNNDDQYRVFTPLTDIPAELISATLLQEDQYFYWHYGVNPFAMFKAAWQTYAIHSRRMGASTITMQVARMRFNINSKKISGKIWQIIRSIQLERHYSKQQILEAYLNLAPYGGNVEGVGAASLIYFNKPITTLNLPEILTLAVIPQNPNARSLETKKLETIRNKFFLRWVEKFPSDKSKASLFKLPLVMQKRSELPFFAPHFVNSLPKNGPIINQPIETTLNLSLQKILERITNNYVKRNHRIGVYNAAVLLVDTRDMSIKGLVGSTNFFNTAISGQINGTDVKRSPGSTLKPFIYALAFDQSLIHPNTMLKDVPHSFGSYNPENFDYDFMGPIKAKDALILSRNIPAIFLANQLTHYSLYHLLSDAHVKDLKAESFYGLALALGGAELTMKELVSLYAMLVNQGVWYPLRYLKNEAMPEGERLLSQEASFLIQDILQETPRPTINFSRTQTSVSWKTGTSSGFRDAWSIGSIGPYVLAVWIGNFDNTSNPAFVGKNIAAPLFFELIDAIKPIIPVSDNFNQIPQGMNLIKIDVCKASGMLPTRFCQDTEKTWFIPGKSPIKSDTIYREVAIDSKTGLRTCHLDSNTRFEIFEFWPSDLLNIFRQAGIQRRSPPLYNPECFNENTRSIKPQINSPKAQHTYILRTLSNTNYIPLTAVTDADVQYIYWFINEAFLAKTSRNKPYYWHAKPGKFVIRVVDDHGQSDVQDLRVELND